MNKLLPAILTFTIMMACNTNEEKKNAGAGWPASIAAPMATVKPYERILHGDTVTDNYFWLKDYFTKGTDSAKVLDYLRAENTYFETMMSGTKRLQQQLFKEMKARIKEQDESVPVFDNGYYYYYRTDEGAEYYKYCRRKGSMEAKEEMLLDVDKMAKGHAYYDVEGIEVSEDNKLLAYGVDDVSRLQYTLYIKNLETGKTYKDAIKHTEGDPVWASDNKTLFYTSKNPVTLLSEQIKRHTLGTDAASDVVVYDEKDKSNYISVGKSKNNRYIIITSAATLSSEVRYIDAATPDAVFRVFQPRIKDVLYDITPLADRFLIHTNLDAPNFRLMECPLNTTGREHWKEVILHRKDVLIEDIDEYKDFTAISERKDGLTRIRIRNTVNGGEHYIDFGEATYAAGITENPDYNSTMLRYNYSSLTTPKAVYDYDMATKATILLKQQQVLGGYDHTNYITERLYATAADGTRIPISLVYKKGFVKDGNAPLLLYGYGAYGATMEPYFSSTRLSLLDRGFAFAIAHIRGGEEMGRQWYEDGKLMNKKNTFTDFIACAHYLLAEKYTSRHHLYAEGASAGGLLMGAVINMEPNLWNGVIAEVPFVDAVNSMMDENIPLTTNEYDEWGDPKEPDAYHYMKSYSPYENIEKKQYPNILVTTGLHDSQVQYFEPAKWVAKLRATKTGDNILLLRTNMDFGHGGASGRFDDLKDLAINFAFLLTLEGISK